jgi:hypothetical protein
MISDRTNAMISDRTNAIGANANMSANYNAADIAQQRQKVFENDLKQKQKDFDKFNNKQIPDKIDFADKADTPLGSEMDKILAEQIALREKQLNMVLETQDKTAASKWLQNGQTQPQQQVQTQPQPNALKIGEAIRIEEPQLLSPRKKVNFVEPIADDFMSLLKKIPVQALAAPMQALAAPVQALAAPVQALAAPVQALAVPVQALAAPNQDPIIEMLTEILAKQNKILDILSHKIE